MSKEFVKERVLKYLMEDLLVPQDMIDTNVPLSEFEEGAEGVLDIIVNVVVKEHGEDYYVPVLIVTCVDEDFVMEGEALQKEIDFLEDVDNITTAGRMILTNGNEMMYADKSISSKKRSNAKRILRNGSKIKRRRKYASWRWMRMWT